MNMNRSPAAAAQIHCTEQDRVRTLSAEDCSDIVRGRIDPVRPSFSAIAQRSGKTEHHIDRHFGSIPCAVGRMSCKSRRIHDFDTVSPGCAVLTVSGGKRCRDLRFSRRKSCHDAVFID